MNVSIVPPGFKLNIAVVGTGIAGMAAAWMLNKVHNVTVFEQQDRLGGHSNTVDAPTRDGIVPVDTGFIVYNERNYPNLTALFKHLGIETTASDMSFAASLDDGRVEYAGTDLNGLFGQRSNLLRPRFWSMMSDLLRFYRQSPALLDDPEGDALSLDEYLHRNRYSEAFITDHLLPMGAAIWSTSAPEMRNYPAAAFVRFFNSHGLLSLTNRPQWRSVAGGSRSYVREISAPWSGRVRHGGVRAIRRRANGVDIIDASGETQRFDHVVIAAHADEAFSMLADADPLERRLLSGWRYTMNRAVLHDDPGLMPKRRSVWSSWNVIGDRNADSAPLCVTYWMNRLQRLDTRENLFVTLNPGREPSEGRVIREFQYSHPYFDQSALKAQRELWTLQGRRRSWFCGSYFGYGFHEDALQSGLAVAEQLGGIQRPWTVADPNGRISVAPAYQRVAA